MNCFGVLWDILWMWYAHLNIVKHCLDMSECCDSMSVFMLVGIEGLETKGVVNLCV